MKNVFAISLIVYLILFLLETVFPGFISNNFSLNWVLGAVLVLGILAALAPEEQEGPETAQKPKKSDYWIFAGLGAIGGLLMFFRSDLNLIYRVLLALVSAGFITGISLFLLLTNDEDGPEESEPDETGTQTLPVLHQIRRFMAKPVKVPLGVIMIGLILLGLSLIQPKNKLQQEIPTLPAEQPSQTAEPQESILVVRPSLQELGAAPITILNGSTQVGSASAMARFLQTKDFTISHVADADSNTYQNALLRFRPEEAKIAVYLADIISGIYPLIDKVPAATDSAGITLILGTPSQ